MQLGLIGYPLGHSKSPEIFAQIFKQSNVKGTYTLFPVKDVYALPQWLTTQPHLQGFNVTIPHKKTIFSLLDNVVDDAKAIGAVNTVKITRANNGIKLIGYNTDYLGFKQSLLSFLDGEKPEKALVLGTGGSAKAVQHALQQLNIDFSNVSRYKKEGCLTYTSLNAETIKQYSLIINTTPLGMHPNVEDYPLIDYLALDSRHFLYDLVYNPIETQFLAKGRLQGAKTKNGLEMLHLQAQKSWEIWNS